jgi:hypothetical protein
MKLNSKTWVRSGLAWVVPLIAANSFAAEIAGPTRSHDISTQGVKSTYFKKNQASVVKKRLGIPRRP